MVFEADEDFIEITEFIASAILIPVILEWIFSNRSHAIMEKNEPNDGEEKL